MGYLIVRYCLKCRNYCVSWWGFMIRLIDIYLYEICVIGYILLFSI